MTKGNQRIIHQVYLTRNFHLISFLFKRNKRGGTLLLWTIQQKMTRSLIYDLKWSINCRGCGTWIDSKNGLSFIISAPSLELYHFRKFFISDISFPMKKKLDCRIIAGELGLSRNFKASSKNRETPTATTATTTTKNGNKQSGKK